MPEGHTIHRIALDHGRLLAGQRVGVSSPQGRFVDNAKLVDGRLLHKVEAYGKHLFYWFEGADLIHVHLGLFGKYKIHQGDEPGPAVRLRLQNGVGDVIDLAGPTDCSLMNPPERDGIVARLGPDPLRRDGSQERFVSKVLASKRAIGLLLMDQSVVSGVGNVYRAESLFLLGIHPELLGCELTPERCAELWVLLRKLLKAGMRADRIVTVDRSEVKLPRGRALKRGEATYVYKREVCLRCGSAVRCWDWAGRVCYACPTCQPR